MSISEMYQSWLRCLAAVGFCQVGMLLSGCKKNTESTSRIQPSVSSAIRACPTIEEVSFPMPEHYPGWKSSYLVFTAAGDNHNVNSWFSCGSPDFKLYVSFYGQNKIIESQLRDLVEGIDGLFEGGMHGFKDTFLFNGWQISRNITHPDHMKYSMFFHGVEYIFMPDDDLTLTAGSLNLFFQINSLLGLCYSSPSQLYEKDNDRQTWQSNLQVPDSLFRADAFVETGVKCFRRDCFEVFMDAYSPTLIGFGVDHLALSALYTSELLNGKNHGVIDVISVRNPAVRRNGEREQLLAGSGIPEWDEFVRAHPEVVNLSFIESKRADWETPGHCSVGYRIPEWVQYQLNHSDCTD